MALYLVCSQSPLSMCNFIRISNVFLNLILKIWFWSILKYLYWTCFSQVRSLFIKTCSIVSLLISFHLADNIVGTASKDLELSVYLANQATVFASNLRTLSYVTGVRQYGLRSKVNLERCDEKEPLSLSWMRATDSCDYFPQFKKISLTILHHLHLALLRDLNDDLFELQSKSPHQLSSTVLSTV